MHTMICKLGLLPADRIVVPKSGLRLVQHHAVYLGQNQYGQDIIAENKIGYGVRLVTSKDFFKDVIEVTKIEKFRGSNSERKVVVQKALQKLNQPYDLINYNCQHFANEITKGKIESEQVNSVFGILKGVAALFALISLGKLISKN